MTNEFEYGLKKNIPQSQKKLGKRMPKSIGTMKTAYEVTMSMGAVMLRKEKTPVQRVKGTPEKLNMISTVTNRGKLRFMSYKETMTAQLFITFLKRLIRGSNRKLFLIVDNLRVHHCNIVSEWLKENKAFIEIFYLPSYSPDLNPDELLNKT